MANKINQSPKKKRGGFRIGAGRKKTGQTICLVLTSEEKEKAKSIGEGSLVDGIKTAIKLFKLD